MPEEEIVIQTEPGAREAGGGGPEMGPLDLLVWGPVLAKVLAAFKGGTGKISFVVRALGRKKRITIEDV